MPSTNHPTAESIAAGHDLRGRTVIVTGGTSGLGAETVRVLAGAGASVVLTGRDPVRGGAAAVRLRATTGNPDIEHAVLDLGSLASVHHFADRFLATGRPLHVLVNNAGIMAVPFSRTRDGFESHFGVNHLGHHALTTALLPALEKAAPARVVCLTSRAHRRSDVDLDDPNYEHRPYDPWQAYGQSKTANALHAVALTAHHGADGITANAVMPGMIRTGLTSHLSDDQLRGLRWTEQDGTLVPPTDWGSIAQGAATTVWAALSPDLDGVGGRYLQDCAIAEPWTRDDDPPHGYHLRYAVDPDRAERLWDLSRRLVEASGSAR